VTVFVSFLVEASEALMGGDPSLVAGMDVNVRLAMGTRGANRVQKEGQGLNASSAVKFPPAWKLACPLGRRQSAPIIAANGR
jgi:hypothetical protein